MAALYEPENTSSLIVHEEAPPPTTADRSRGGWTTTPFTLATGFGLTLANGGCATNLIVFLIKEFNIKSIDAAQINNVVGGFVNFFPLIAAILADSYLGCFSVIWISSLISLLGLILLVLTATIDVLRPLACEPGSSLCATPSTIQYAVLYSALALASIGIGGTRFTLAAMGANQLTKLEQQSTYLNWYFFGFYSASFTAGTAIVYIQDNIGWGWGFGICVAANVLALALFLIGGQYYLHDKPKASPFKSLLHVVVARVRKRKTPISSENSDYYYGDDGVKGITAEAPTNMSRASCTVQQVEDLKSLIRILPLWTSSIFLSTPIGIQLSLTILQALTTDRHVGRSFQFPVASIAVVSLISSSLGVFLINQCVLPLWKKFSNKNMTPLQQIGIGHVFNVASMAISALVESKRRATATAHAGSTMMAMSIFWLVPQMVVVGLGEAFHFPGQVTLYYQEFPTSLKSLATAMVAMLVGVAFYLSTAIIDLLRRITDWLADDINNGRIDNVYWVMVVIGVVNFIYYIIISWLYNYKNVENVEEYQSVSVGE